MLFKLGLFLIPFENLFFAPSAGWAAIAPIIFFVYVLLNITVALKFIKKVDVYIIILLTILSLVNFLRFSFLIENVIDNIITLALGYIFYLALKIRYLSKKKLFLEDIECLFNSYLLSLVIGVIQFFVYKLKIDSIINIFRLLSKRFYYPRVQLTYAEPSFIPIHLFGVMLFILMFCIKNKIKLKNKIYLIFYINVIITNLMVQSTRLVLDTLVVLSIILFCYILKSKKRIIKILLIFSIPLFVIIATNIAKNDKRLDKILKKGIYADASLASRWFRVNASLIGYKERPFETILGYGVGNLYIPFQLGYEQAKNDYNNSYLAEVNSLEQAKPKSLFSMPIKIISEFGMIVFGLILLFNFSYKYIDIYLILMYLYLQFDSYALYTVWIYIFFKNNFKNIILDKEIKK